MQLRKIQGLFKTLERERERGGVDRDSAIEKN